MNIEQYRALKAQEAEQAASTPSQPVAEQTTETPVVDTQTSDDNKTIVTDEKPTTPQTPEKVIIDGVGEVSFDELKNGYLRQSDYTKKTQDLSRQRKENEDALTFYEMVKRNPQLAQQISQTTPVPATLDPHQAKNIQLENMVYDLMLDKEISDLQRQHDDFDVREVLQIAQSKQLNNLNDAYLIYKGSKSLTPATTPVPDVETLKKQIRDELIAEMNAEKDSTQSIIRSNNSNAVIQNNTPTLSESEKRVARMMRLSDTDYIKWRDVGKKK